jgi:glycosyltransferase involved in cell wall biosynthesis
MISKACVSGMYQRKLEELARLPDLDLHVMVPPYWREGKKRLILERMYTAGYHLHVLAMAFNGNFHLHFYPGLRRVFAQVHPDLVHIDEEPYNLATFQAMRLSRLCGARAIFFTWQNLLRHYPFPFSSLERYNLTHAAYAVAGNQEAVHVLRAKGYTGATTVIPQFGVDPELYCKHQTPTRADRPFTIGYLGRMVEEKGVQTLLRAVAELQGEWRLRLVGDGPYLPQLHALCVRLGLGQRAAFQARLPSQDMPRQLNELDVLVLPSLTRRNWKEQFGRVLIEAMACEVPVVGSSSGEIPNLIADAGDIFPEGNVPDLRDALVKLIRSPDLCADLGRRGRARVLARYTQRQIALDTYAVYTQVLTQGPDS